MSIQESGFGQSRRNKESSRKTQKSSRTKKKNDSEDTKRKRGQNEEIIEKFSSADIKHFNPSARIKAGQLTEDETKILQSTRKTLAEKYTKINHIAIINVQNIRKSINLEKKNVSRDTRKSRKNKIQKRVKERKNEHKTNRAYSASGRKISKSSRSKSKRNQRGSSEKSRFFKGLRKVKRSGRTTNLLNIDLASISEDDLSDSKIVLFNSNLDQLIQKAENVKSATVPALEAFLISEGMVGQIIDVEATVKAANTSLAIAEKIPRIGGSFKGPHDIVKLLPDKVKKIKDNVCSFDKKLDDPEALTQKIYDVMDTLVIHMNNVGDLVSTTYDYVDLSYQCGSESGVNEIKNSTLAAAILYQNKVGDAANAVEIVNTALDNAKSKLVTIKNDIESSTDVITTPFTTVKSILSPLEGLGIALTEEITLPWIGETCKLGCPSGTDLYGGMCYSSACEGYTASDGWVGTHRSAVCTCGGCKTSMECPFGKKIVFGGVDCKKGHYETVWDWCPFGSCSGGTKCKNIWGNCKGSRGNHRKWKCDKKWKAGECTVSLVAKERCYPWTHCGKFGHAYATWDDEGPTCPDGYNNWGFFCMEGELVLSIEIIFDEIQKVIDTLDVFGILGLIEDLIDELVSVILSPFMGPLDNALSNLFPDWEPPIDPDQLADDFQYELNQVYNELTSASSLISNTLDEIMEIDLTAIENIECVDIEEKLAKYGSDFASEKASLLQEVAGDKIKNKVLSMKLGAKANEVMEKFAIFQTALEDPMNTGLSYLIDEFGLDCN